MSNDSMIKNDIGLERDFKALSDKPNKQYFKSRSARLYGVKNYSSGERFASIGLDEIKDIYRFFDRTTGGLVNGDIIATGLISGSTNTLSLLRNTSASEVDLSVIGSHTLFTVPNRKKCIIQHIVIREPSSALVAASFSFGFDLTGSDVVADSTYVSVDATNKYQIVNADAGAVIGNASEVFQIYVNTIQTVTVNIDVFGYLINA